MRDFPIFTTEFGIASLTLKEIPYKKVAYIRILEVFGGSFRELLGECAGFCRMAGAEQIFVTGHEEVEAFPLYTILYEMRGCVSEPQQEACLFPVTEETVAQWRSIYNEAMAPVDTASTLEKRDEQRLLHSCGACFVHEKGRLLGIGWVEGNRLEAICAVEKGAGRQVLSALMGLCTEDQMVLQVASTNERAIRLYESMGFVKTGEVARWYQVPKKYPL